jgi:hypothetical protein
LLCQALLNQEKLEKDAEPSGKSMAMPADYTELSPGLRQRACVGSFLNCAVN